jgi:hypothetical protein
MSISTIGSKRKAKITTSATIDCIEGRNASQQGVGVIYNSCCLKKTIVTTTSSENKT